MCRWGTSCENVGWCGLLVCLFVCLFVLLACLLARLLDCWLVG